MFSTRIAVVIATAFAALFVGIDIASAQTAPAKGFTQHDFVRAIAAFNRRTMLEPYQKVGRHDVKWDADATKFLEGMCIRMANARMGPVYSLPDMPNGDALRKLAESARAKGCDDPLVDYTFAILLQDLGARTEARALIDNAADRLLESRYPINRATYAAFRKWSAAPAGPAKEAAYGKVRDVFCTLLSTWDFKDIDRRILVQHLGNMVESLPPDKQQALADAAQATPNADPWMLHFFVGRRHVNAAWEARGTGWGNTVTQEGWAGFEKHLTAARTELTAAWKLQPAYPEPATSMIAVAMGMGAQLNEDPRAWFDRAREGQIDYADAYDFYRNAILPRWGGSTEMLEALAKECLDSKRYDTEVPWQYARTLETIVSDSHQPQYWGLPGVYEGAHEMAAGYAKAFGPSKAKESALYASFAAAVALRGERYAEARKELDALGDRLEPESLRRLGLMPSFAVSRMYALTSPDAEAIANADQLVLAHAFEGAIRTYQTAVDHAAAVTDKPAGGGATPFLKTRLQQLNWQKQFEAGEVVDIQPKKDDLAGWVVMSGTWRIDKDGALVGKAEESGGGATIVFVGGYVSPRFELEGRLNWIPPREGKAGTFGVSVTDGSTGFQGSWLDRTGEKVSVRHDWDETFHRDLDVVPDNTVAVTQWDDRFITRFNGHMTVHIWPMKILTGTDGQIAFGSSIAPAGTEFRLRELQLRKLTEEPDWKAPHK